MNSKPTCQCLLSGGQQYSIGKIDAIYACEQIGEVGLVLKARKTLQVGNKRGRELSYIITDVIS